MPVESAANFPVEMIFGQALADPWYDRRANLTERTEYVNSQKNESTCHVQEIAGIFI